MSQQKKLERVLDLLLSEDSDRASELLHQIIVEKARVIYESIVDEEDEEMDKKDELDESDEVGGEPNKDFTDEIKSDTDEIDTDEHNDGEASEDDDIDYEESDEDEDEDEFGDEDEGSTEDRVEDLESQLAELRAEFDALMGEELEEPNHADLGGEMSDIENEFGDEDEFGGDDEEGNMPDFGGDTKVVGEVVANMFEKSKKPKLKTAPQKKDLKKDKKMDEETQFLSKVADTGQCGTAKLVGTGKDSSLGAEQTKSSFTNIPPRKDYGGKSSNILGSKTTGGEYGKYNGDSATCKTPTNNVNIKPKGSSTKADTTAKFTGGKVAGDSGNKSPFSKKPS